jgi:hypothetical protein
MYFEALVSCRLDAEAESVAQRLPGMSAASRMAAAKGALSKRTSSAAAPPANETWWVAAPR